MLKDKTLENLIGLLATCKNVIIKRKQIQNKSYKRYTSCKSKKTSPAQPACQNYYLCRKCSESHNKKRSIKLIELLIKRKIITKNTPMTVKGLVRLIEKAKKSDDLKRVVELNSLVDFRNNRLYAVKSESTDIKEVIKIMRNYSQHFIMNTHFVKFSENGVFVRYDNNCKHHHVILLNPRNIENYNPENQKDKKQIFDFFHLYKEIRYMLKYPLQDYFIKRKQRELYNKPILTQNILEFHERTKNSRAIRFGIFSPAYKQPTIITTD